MIGTQSQFARHVGVSRQYISKLANEGKLALTDDGLVDFEASGKKIKANADPAREDAGKQVKTNKLPPSFPAEIPTQLDNNAEEFRYARTRKMQADADRAELEAEQLAGQLIKREDVKYVLDDIALSFVASLENMPAQLAPIVLPLRTLEDVTLAITDSTRTIIENLNRAIRSKL